MESENRKNKPGRPRKGTEVITVHVTTDVANYLRDIGAGDASVGAGKLLAEIGGQHIALLQNLATATEYMNGTSHALLKEMSKMVAGQKEVLDTLSTLMAAKPKGNA